MSERTDGAYLWTILFRAFKSVERRDLESVQELGFACLSDFAVLEVLYHKGPMSVRTIGEKVMLTSGSITTAIQRAERNGWVWKRPSAEDGRVLQVGLTDKGLRRIAEAYGTHAANLEKIFNSLGRRERVTLARLLKKVGKA